MTKMTMEINNGWLPEDVLGFISKKLDFDDLFPFGGVCHEWRESFAKFLGQFMASPAPLAIKMNLPPNGVVTFYSISDGKSCKAKLPEMLVNELDYSMLSYIGFSSGYLAMVNRKTNTFFLMNPFMRRKMQIPQLELPPRSPNILDRSMLACALDSSEEFVFVVISRPLFNLFIYQSRKGCWESYDINGTSPHIVDVVVLHRALYAIDSHGRIGVLSLNTPRVKFLVFKNVPKVRFCKLRFVVSEGQLLVVQFRPLQEMEFKVFRIDFTTMEWVEIETLGDRALFLSRDTRCYALSNPGRWGYDSDCVYYVDGTNGRGTCSVFSMEAELIRSITRAGVVVEANGDDGLQHAYRARGQPWFVDWCFRNLRDEVDYSLDE